MEQETLEARIDAAAAQAAGIVKQFSPAAGAAIAAGAEVEPIISGLIHMFALLFAHKAKRLTAQPQPPAK